MILCDPVSAISDAVSSAGDAISNAANYVSQSISPQYSAPIGPGLENSPAISAPVDVSQFSAPAAGSFDLSGAGGGAGGMSNLATSIVGPSGDYYGQAGLANPAATAGAAPLSTAAPSFSSTAAASTPSFAPSTTGIAGGGGASAASLGMAPGGDLNTGGLSGLNSTDATGNLGDTYKTANPLLTGTGTASSSTPNLVGPGGAVDTAKDGGFWGDVKAVGNALAPFAGPAAAAAGLLMNATKGSSNLPQQTPLVGQAQGQAKQAEQIQQDATPLINALNTNKLPPGAQAAIDQTLNANIAQIRSQYAGMGLSNSTMELEAIQGARQFAEQQKFAQMQSLVGTGLNMLNAGTGEANNATGIYQALQQRQLAQNAALGGSISNFAAALAGQPARGQQQQVQ
jgi:hypothetical protein